MKEKRNYALDLLRIVSMVMVVFLHCYNKAGLSNNITPAYGTANWYFIQSLNILCYVAVNCFVLISGYFLCTSSFRLRRWVSVWGQALLYSVGIYLLLALTGLGGTTFSFLEFAKSCIVFPSGRYWFVRAYLLMYLLSPILNILIRAMTKRQHFLCCCLLLGLFSLLQNVFYFSDFSGMGGGYSYLWFCVLYLAAAYFRLYVPQRVPRQRWMLAGYLLCVLFICAVRFTAYAVTPAIFGGVRGESIFNYYNAVPVVAASLFLFQFFRGISIQKPAAKRLIGAIAPLTFGVYLLHEHPTLRPLLWSKLNFPALAASPALPAAVLAAALGIFAVGCGIEYLRRLLFRVTGLTAALQHLCDKLQNHLQHKIFKHV